MKIKKISLFFKTIKYLKFKQIFYRIYYFFSKKIFLDFNLTYKSIKFIKINQFIVNKNSKLNNNEFTFLNQSKKFDVINWNFLGYGKLWNYNLKYFNYLNDIDQNYGLDLINDYINFYKKNKNNKEPYPTSLRLINWINFLSKHSINDSNINDTIVKDSKYLYNNIEYHLMGNHVLENSFAILFCSYYLKSEKLYNLSRKILFSELQEQILSDGAHFELSTMYHQILLIKILNCIDLISNNESWKKDRLLKDFLLEKAALMLSWNESIAYSDGSLPALNDSARNQLRKTHDFFEYSKKLNIKWKKINLKKSGYRRWNQDKFQILIDVGQIGASYIPGHAHADTFNFELIYNSNPIIVDPGISTYENNNIREIERSTNFHNTIKLNGKNSSEIWGAFRIADRANIIDLVEEEYCIKASHDGYKKYGLVHERKFSMLRQKFIIQDFIQGITNNTRIESFLHFHPKCKIQLLNNSIRVNEELIINFEGCNNFKVEEYNFPIGFNKYTSSKKIILNTNRRSKIELKYED